MALDLPARERAELAAWRDELIAGRDDLRPVTEEALHVTLAFLGYRPEKEIPAIAAAIEAAFAETDTMCGSPQPLLVPATVVGVPTRRPRLFALDLEDPDGTAAALQRAVSEALEGGRFYKPEKRPFWPHVTLARVKRDRRAAPLAGVSPRGLLHAERITLYRSALRPQGAEYHPLAQIGL